MRSVKPACASPPPSREAPRRGFEELKHGLFSSLIIAGPDFLQVFSSAGIPRQDKIIIGVVERIQNIDDDLAAYCVRERLEGIKRPIADEERWHDDVARRCVVIRTTADTFPKLRRDLSCRAQGRVTPARPCDHSGPRDQPAEPVWSKKLERRKNRSSLDDRACRAPELGQRVAERFACLPRLPRSPDRSAQNQNSRLNLGRAVTLRLGDNSAAAHPIARGIEQAACRGG